MMSVVVYSNKINILGHEVTSYVFNNKFYIEYNDLKKIFSNKEIDVPTIKESPRFDKPVLKYVEIKNIENIKEYKDCDSAKHIFPQLEENYEKILEYLQNTITNKISLKVSISSYLSTRNKYGNIEKIMDYIEENVDVKNFEIDNGRMYKKNSEIISVRNLYSRFGTKYDEISLMSFILILTKIIPKDKQIMIDHKINYKIQTVLDYENNSKLKYVIDFSKLKKACQKDLNNIVDKKEKKIYTIEEYTNTFFNNLNETDTKIIKEKLEIQKQINDLKKEYDEKIKLLLDK